MRGMYEVLIRARDKVPMVNARHSELSHRGDVIAIQHYGWKFSDIERNSGEWIHITAKLKAEDIYALTVGNRPNEPRIKRRQRINIDGIKPGSTFSRAALLAKVI